MPAQFADAIAPAAADTIASTPAAADAIASTPAAADAIAPAAAGLNVSTPVVAGVIAATGVGCREQLLGPARAASERGPLWRTSTSHGADRAAPTSSCLMRLREEAATVDLALVACAPSAENDFQSRSQVPTHAEVWHAASLQEPLALVRAAELHVEAGKADVGQRSCTLRGLRLRPIVCVRLCGGVPGEHCVSRCRFTFTADPRIWKVGGRASGSGEQALATSGGAGVAARADGQTGQMQACGAAPTGHAGLDLRPGYDSDATDTDDDDDFAFDVADGRADSGQVSQSRFSSVARMTHRRDDGDGLLILP
jgi:hypothetical protein